MSEQQTKQQVNVGWTSSHLVWSWGAVSVAVLVLVAMCWLQYSVLWNSLQRYYAPIYAKAGFRAQHFARSASYYDLIMMIDRQGRHQFAIPEEITLYPEPGGHLSYQLTAEARERGIVSAMHENAQYRDQVLHEQLAEVIYDGHALMDYLKLPACVALVVLAVLLFFAGPLDRKRAIAQLRGQRLAGTEQVTSAGFNRRMRRRKKTGGPLQDGVVFLDAAQSWLGRKLDSHANRGVYVPREREQQHIVMMGDTGQGKSTAIRQVLRQVEERGELATIYDPDGQYARQFCRPERGDVNLNP